MHFTISNDSISQRFPLENNDKTYIFLGKINKQNIIVAMIYASSSV